MIYLPDLIGRVIRPTLEALRLPNVDAATSLLVGTCACESALGTYLAQLNGSALGIYQVEPRTHDWIWLWLQDPTRIDLRERVRELSGRRMEADLMTTDLRYATAIARLRYWVVPEEIPIDLRGQANYWCRHYQGLDGTGTPEDYLHAWRERVSMPIDELLRIGT